MLAISYGYSFAFFTALIVIAGDFVIKVAADAGHGPGHRLVLAGCALYAASALVWFAAMQQITLAQAGVAYSMLTLLALCAIGAIWFDEPVRAREAAGIGCALVAMILMVRVG